MTRYICGPYFPLEKSLSRKIKMAEGDAPPQKKIKLQYSKLRETLACGIDMLENDVECCMCLLKITNSCASTRTTFSRCSFDIKRSFDDRETDPQAGRVYPIPSLFEKGVKFLKEIISDKVDLSTCDNTFKIAYERLQDVLLNEQDIIERLNRENCSETDYTVIIAHHFLKKLSVNQSYLIDHKSRDKMEWNGLVRCPCCKEVDIHGKFGDCSIGEERILHGRLDILLGHVVVLKSSCTSSLSALEVKKSKLSLRSQAIGEAIVFSFLLAKENPEFDNFLIPTVAITRQEVVIVMYDSKNDILCESTVFPLVTELGGVGQLHRGALLALWLTVNYTLFCSGVTQLIKDHAFTSDFLLRTNEEVKNIYKEQLRFGDINVKEEGFEKFKKGFGLFVAK